MEELGLESGRVRVVPCSDAWPLLYAAEIERVAPLLAAGSACSGRRGRAASSDIVGGEFALGTRDRIVPAAVWSVAS